MQKKRAGRWQFIKMKRANGPTAMPSPPPPNASLSGELYQTLADLPLSRFIDVSVDGNFSALIKSGTVDLPTLLLHWIDLSQQYNEMVGGNDSLIKARILRDITVLSITIEQVYKIVDTLIMVTYEPLEDKLCDLLNTRINFTDRQKAIDRALRLVKQFELKLEMKRDQYDTLQKKSEDNEEKPTREYFKAWLITLSDWKGYQLTEAISTYDFCERIKRMGEAERRAKQNNVR